MSGMLVSLKHPPAGPKEDVPGFPVRLYSFLSEEFGGSSTHLWCLGRLQIRLCSPG